VVVVEITYDSDDAQVPTFFDQEIHCQPKGGTLIAGTPVLQLTMGGLYIQPRVL